MSGRVRRGHVPSSVRQLAPQGADIMVLSSSQHLLLALSLAMCGCFLLPRMLGVSKEDPTRRTPTTESQGNRHLPRRTLEKSNHMDQMKGEMEKQLKAEKRGAGRSMAFTLMPIYAVGVALFAAYKFSKVKSNEKNRSKLSKDDETKTKATENQLLELEKHLAHTEKMLNSLLTQLDPLSNCVNTLAAEQKDEIMNQLQSIRQLMKKSGMDKTTINNPGNQSSENTLEDLIDALNIQNPGISRGDENKPDEKDVDLPAHNFVSEEPVIHPGLSHCEEDSPQPEEDVAQSPTSDGLRKRNVKD